MAIGTPSIGSVVTGFTQNLTVTPPSTINDGDRLTILAFMELDPNDNFSVSGFTLEHQQWYTTFGDVSVGILHKVASSESGNYTLAIDGGANRWLNAVCVAWPSADQSTAFDATTLDTNNGGNSDSITASAITTATDGSVVILIGGCSQGGAGPTTIPSGYTAIGENVDSGGIFSACYKNVVSAGVETPGSWTGWGSGADSLVITCAVKAAAAASGNPAYYYAQM